MLYVYYISIYYFKVFVPLDRVEVVTRLKSFKPHHLQSVINGKINQRETLKVVYANCKFSIMKCWPSCFRLSILRMEIIQASCKYGYLFVLPFSISVLVSNSF